MPGVLKSIAQRPTDGEPMREVREANIVMGRGIDFENRKPGRRELTMISVEAWDKACLELGVKLPWHARRANLLIEGIDLAGTLGEVIQIGPVQVRIHGETRPCGIMDAQQPGLREALKPEIRGGVHGEVLVGGVIRVGDPVAVL